jgi:hypothetical protein
MVLVRLLEGASAGSEIMKHKACCVDTAHSVLLSFFSLRCGLCPLFFFFFASRRLNDALRFHNIVTGFKHMSTSG